MSEPPISASTIDALRRIALRYAETPDDADDLVQDMLLAALVQRRVPSDDGFLAWAHGVFRRRALFVARTEGRRRRREALYAADADPSGEAIRKLPREFIDTLSPSLKIVALLANLGLGRAEIASLLGIADTALRQRISSLRRAWREFGGTPELVEIPRGYPSLRGPRRRAVKADLARVPGARFAVADPDGHAIIFGVAHESAGDGNLKMQRVVQRTD